MTVTAEHVMQARRELAKRSLSDFACLVDIPTVPVGNMDDADSFSVMKLDKLADHHALLCESLQKVESGEIPNLMVLMPPGSAKSTYVDVVFVPWFMARQPRRNVILASYASDIAKKQGRRARQLIKSRSFANLLNVGLSADQSAADEWALDNGSEYMSGGLLSGLTGNRAALGILDDPIRGREAAESQTIRDKTWDAYTDDFCSRLIPGAPQIMILCMTGDTPVLMADGCELPLRDIRVGDEIATYDGERITSSRVMNWANQGNDLVYEIMMTSGTTVRANERHPFLVERNGVHEWVRLKNINVGDRILKATGVNGVVSSAHMKDAQSRSNAKATATHTIKKLTGTQGIGLRLSIAPTVSLSSVDSGIRLSPPNMTPSSPSSEGPAPYASGVVATDLLSIGVQADFASTTIMTPEKLEGCSATTATFLLADQEHKNQCFVPLSDMFSVGLDEVASITPVGVETVYDIQVEGTENFIANGLVSHNTRWHQDDPAGRILPEDWKGESGVFEGRDGRTWHVICLPAVADMDDDPLGRAKGETLWPEWFSDAHWAPFKRNRRTWTSLYQQKPAPDEGTYFQRDRFTRYTEQPNALRYYGTSDYAVTEGGGDYTRLRIWGIDNAIPANVYLVDGWGGQTSSEEWISAQVDLIARHRPLAWFGEGGVIQKAIEGMLVRKMRDRRVSCRLEWLSSVSDKPTRARSAQALVNEGRVHVRDDHDGDCFIDECVAFPAGRYDDDVDNLSLIGRAVDKLEGPAKPRTERPRVVAQAGGWAA